MLLEDLEDIPITPKKPSLGIHLLPYLLNADEEKRFIEWISSLPFTVYFIPITHYNQDYVYLRNLNLKIKNSVIVPMMNPLEIYTFIGKLDYFISSSLHGGIFSYKHNVPFILLNYNEKMHFFMKDRGLERYTFTNFDEMKTVFTGLLMDNPDYSEKISRDLDVLHKHVEHLMEILPYGKFYKEDIVDLSSEKNYQIQNLQSYIRSLEAQLTIDSNRIKSFEQVISERDGEISLLKEELYRAKGHSLSLEKELSEIKKSITWQLIAKYQNCIVDRAMAVGTRRRAAYDLGLKAGRLLMKEGPESLLWNSKKFLKNHSIDRNDYNRWILANEPRDYELKELKRQSLEFKYRPKISILTPVWNTKEPQLRAAIDSVMAQVYDNWEMCIVDGGSTEPHVRRVLQGYARQDKRIKVKLLEENKGIAGNTNEANSLAKGEFIALLDHDDTLAPFALYEVVKLLNLDQDADFVYTDEDKIDELDKRFAPFFKPGWSPDLLLSCGYTNHLSIYRKDILDRIGGFREEFEGSQDYDMLLRFTETIDERNIAHIPKVLYHWRHTQGSTACDPHAKKDLVVMTHKMVLEDVLRRRNLQASVLDGKWPTSYRIKREISGNPLISIIIPTKDHPDILRNCINSIKTKTSYANYEIIIVNNNSSELATLEYLRTSGLPVLDYSGSFNFSKINNYASEHSHGDYLLFLNNDTEVISPGWIDAMLEHAQRPEVGAVGCKLLYPDGSIQHAGVIMGLSPDPIYGVAGHILTRCHYGGQGYFDLLIDTIRNYSAVTGAAMMIRKSLFQKIGGFNEDLAVSYNDVDLCLRLREKGYLIVYTPYAEIYHHESVSRGYQVDVREADYMLRTWNSIIEADPYYNPNLTLRAYDGRLNRDD